MSLSPELFGDLPLEGGKFSGRNWLRYVDYDDCDNVWQLLITNNDHGND